MTTIDTLLAALTRTLPVALVGLAACTDGGMTDPGPEPDPNDTTAPSVVSTTPTAAATSVGDTAKIVITFSEAMDRATVEAGYQSQQLPFDKVSMSWSPEMTVLTISPDEPLAYAQGLGTDPSTVTPLSYGITIGTEAADLAGNPLAAPLELTFSTKRRMKADLSLEPTLSRTTLGGSALGEQIDVLVGDSTLSNAAYRGYLSFDLAPLPANIEVIHALFSGRQAATEGTPYALGGIVGYHLTFTEMTGVGSIAPMSSPGMFSQDGTLVTKSIEVTSQVADDIAHRAERGDLSQYRLQIDTQTDGDNEFDRATFSKDSFAMSVVYIAD